MAFSATDAALEGFRLARRHPRAVIAWALATLAFNVISIVSMILIAGSSLTSLMQMGRDPSGSPEEMMSLFAPLIGLYAVLIPVTLVFVGILTTAVYRATLTDAADRLGFLRLGADEIRQILVALIVGILGFVVIFAVTLVVAIIGGVLAAATSGGGDPNIAGIFIMMALIYLGMFVASIAFYVKFSFAGPMTFLDRRIRVFQSWGATKGYFWRLFGCYLLAVVLGVLVALLGWFMGMALMLAFGGDVSQMMAPDMSSLSTYLTPAMIAYIVLSSGISALTYAIFLSPAMAAYRDIRGPSTPETAEVFA